MKGMEHFWAIILAAGEGERVRSFTHDGQGRHVPKQFWSLDGPDSLLGLAMRRAEVLVPRHRIVPVVAAQHRHWWKAELFDFPPRHIVVQPRNKGTAAGILLPLAHVLLQDPAARVLVLPSDHVVAHEKVLARSIVAAARAAVENPRRVVLLGMRPQEDDQGYGWIMPGDAAGEAELRRVQAFVEKPDTSTARLLARRGGLLNSLIMTASGPALLRLFQRTMPRVVHRFLHGDILSPAHLGTLDRLYRSVPTCDFSRDVLEASSPWLSVIPVPDCGWADIGTPSRLRPHLRDPGPQDAGTPDSARP